jgi:hypothetical protein
LSARRAIAVIDAEKEELPATDKEEFLAPEIEADRFPAPAKLADNEASADMDGASVPRPPTIIALPPMDNGRIKALS